MTALSLKVEDFVRSGTVSHLSQCHAVTDHDIVLPLGVGRRDNYPVAPESEGPIRC